MMMFNDNDTIAAISSGAGNFGIGIVRMSGKDAIDIIKKIFLPAKEKDISESKTHTVHYGTISSGTNVLDEVLVLVMKAPNTYTREDVVEIDCHGGSFVTQQILDLLIKNGARAAEPGEFTKRAFLNGRIDLSQAEAVIDVINAESDNALKSAVTQLKGSVSKAINALRAVLLEKTAYIEAALDDPEHIEMEGFEEELYPLLKDIRARVNKLIDTADDGRIMKEGIRTVILGKPNVGKSSLLNALAGHERAIVTDIAGTTRDALEEHIRFGGIRLNVIDTAGIRETEDVIEKIGVDKARKYAEDADLTIFVADVSRELEEDDLEILRLIKNKKMIILLNKQDLEGKITKDQIKAVVNEVCGDQIEVPVLETALTEDSGLEELSAVIKQLFYNKEINFNDQIYITNARQKEALKAAEESLKKAEESIESGLSEDFFTIDMMAAYEALGKVTGDTVEDDLADEIFSKFCMGK